MKYLMFRINDKFTLVIMLGIIVLLSIYTSQELHADSNREGDPAFLSFGLGKYDFNRKKETGAELRVEYRSEKQVGIFKPFLAVAATNTSQGFVGAGVLLDFFVDFQEQANIFLQNSTNCKERAFLLKRYLYSRKYIFFFM